MKYNHGRQQNRGIPGTLKRALREARRTKLEEKATTPTTVAFLIATGKITRDRACDGKKRYHTYGYAVQVREFVSKELGAEQEVYACPFCGGFHLASLREMAS